MRRVEVAKAPAAFLNGLGDSRGELRARMPTEHRVESGLRAAFRGSAAVGARCSIPSSPQRTSQRG